MKYLKTLQKISASVLAAGVPIVGTGMYLDDLTFWLAADIYFMCAFTFGAVVLFKSASK